MASLKYSGNLELMTVTLDSAYTAASGSMALTAGHGARLPSAGDFWIRTKTGTYRAFKVTARSTDTLTVTAAQDGTSDGNLDAGTELFWVLTASALGQLRADLLPTRATMWGDEFLITVGGGTRNVAVDTAQIYNFASGDTHHSDGDTSTSSFVLAAGTYTLCVLGWTDSGSGKIDWYIDDVLVVSGQDWYSATRVRNVVKTDASISVSGNGRHVLKLVINGKNASSSSYYQGITKVYLLPASDVKSV